MTAKILGISFVLALGAAFLVRYILIAGMSNVHKAVKADAYLDEESFSLVDSNDTFLYTQVKDRIEFVPICTTQVESHQILHLLPAVYLMTIKFCFQIVQLVSVCFANLNSGTVVVLKCSFNSLGIVRKVEDKGIMLLRVCPIEA